MSISAMRDWLAACPAIEQETDDVSGLRINFLGAEPMHFSIEDSPTDPVLLRYFSGTVRAKNYALTSRLDFAEQDAIQAASSGIMDAICSWIEEQNDKYNFPVLGANRKVQRVDVTSTGYILSVDANSCKFQMQLQVQYYQPRKEVKTE